MPTDVGAITMSNATLFYAPLGTTLPADNLAVGAAWPVGWVVYGLTSAPLVLAYSYETKAPEIQEAMGAVKRKKISEEVTLETTMAQLDFAGLPSTWGGTNTVVAAGVGQVGKETFKIGGAAQLPIRMWGFEAEQEDEEGNVFPVRGFVWKATGEEGGELEFSREEYSGIPLKLSALEDLSKPKGERLLQLVRVTEAAS